MNNLYQHPQYYGFHMKRKGPQINHLSFIDDVTIFTIRRRNTLRLIIETLVAYDDMSGQLINKDKSYFLLHDQDFPSIVSRIRSEIGYQQRHSSITHLGCPIYIIIKRISHYSRMISKVVSRIFGWQSRLLSYIGKAILVKHVLQSIPVYILSAYTLLKLLLNSLCIYLFTSFWGGKIIRKSFIGLG